MFRSYSSSRSPSSSDQCQILPTQMTISFPFPFQVRRLLLLLLLCDSLVDIKLLNLSDQASKSGRRLSKTQPTRSLAHSLLRSPLILAISAPSYLSSVCRRLLAPPSHLYLSKRLLQATKLTTYKCMLVSRSRKVKRALSLSLMN